MAPESKVLRLHVPENVDDASEHCVVTYAHAPRSQFCAHFDLTAIDLDPGRYTLASQHIKQEGGLVSSGHEAKTHDGGTAARERAQLALYGLHAS
ncbi:hypothetical protein GCM10007242_31110 [Pigmentiphaga litoralis]|nr:hypothetical protein GCM10007242_31110 [Pigmentiphaga litoralis]